jgi:hypothetical protein
MDGQSNKERKSTGYNSTFAIGGVSCSADSFVVEIPPIVNLQNVLTNAEYPAIFF